MLNLAYNLQFFLSLCRSRFQRSNEIQFMYIALKELSFAMPQKFKFLEIEKNSRRQM